MAVTERWGGLRIEPYKPNPKDADLDQIVQEGTIWERPKGTFIADELGNLLQEGIPGRTMEDRRGRVIVDRNGKRVDYTPSWAGQRLSTGEQFRTVGQSNGTLAESSRTIGQTRGTINTSPELDEEKLRFLRELSDDDLDKYIDSMYANRKAGQYFSESDSEWIVAALAVKRERQGDKTPDQINVEERTPDDWVETGETVVKNTKVDNDLGPIVSGDEIEETVNDYSWQKQRKARRMLARERTKKVFNLIWGGDGNTSKDPWDVPQPENLEGEIIVEDFTDPVEKFINLNPDQKEDYIRKMFMDEKEIELGTVNQRGEDFRITAESIVEFGPTSLRSSDRIQQQQNLNRRYGTDDPIEYEPELDKNIRVKGRFRFRVYDKDNNVVYDSESENPTLTGDFKNGGFTRELRLLENQILMEELGTDHKAVFNVDGRNIEIDIRSLDTSLADVFNTNTFTFANQLGIKTARLNAADKGVVVWAHKGYTPSKASPSTTQSLVTAGKLVKAWERVDELRQAKRLDPNNPEHAELIISAAVLGDRERYLRVKGMLSGIDVEKLPQSEADIYSDEDNVEQALKEAGTSYDKAPKGDDLLHAMMPESGKLRDNVLAFNMWSLGEDKRKGLDGRQRSEAIKQTPEVPELADAMTTYAQNNDTQLGLPTWTITGHQSPLVRDGEQDLSPFVVDKTNKSILSAESSAPAETEKSIEDMRDKFSRDSLIAETSFGNVREMLEGIPTELWVDQGKSNPLTREDFTERVIDIFSFLTHKERADLTNPEERKVLILEMVTELLESNVYYLDEGEIIRNPDGTPDRNFIKPAKTWNTGQFSFTEDGKLVYLSVSDKTTRSAEDTNLYTLEELKEMGMGAEAQFLDIPDDGFVEMVDYDAVFAEAAIIVNKYQIKQNSLQEELDENPIVVNGFSGGVTVWADPTDQDSVMGKELVDDLLPLLDGILRSENFNSEDERIAVIFGATNQIQELRFQTDNLLGTFSVDSIREGTKGVKRIDMSMAYYREWVDMLRDPDTPDEQKEEIRAWVKQGVFSTTIHEYFHALDSVVTDSGNRDYFLSQTTLLEVMIGGGLVELSPDGRLKPTSKFRDLGLTNVHITRFSDEIVANSAEIFTEEAIEKAFPLRPDGTRENPVGYAMAKVLQKAYSTDTLKRIKNDKSPKYKTSSIYWNTPHEVFARMSEDVFMAQYLAKHDLIDVHPEVEFELWKNAEQAGVDMRQLVDYVFNGIDSDNPLVQRLGNEIRDFNNKRDEKLKAAPKEIQDIYLGLKISFGDENAAWPTAQIKPQRFRLAETAEFSDAFFDFMEAQGVKEKGFTPQRIVVPEILVDAAAKRIAETERDEAEAARLRSLIVDDGGDFEVGSVADGGTPRKPDPFDENTLPEVLESRTTFDPRDPLYVHYRSTEDQKKFRADELYEKLVELGVIDIPEGNQSFQDDENRDQILYTLEHFLNNYAGDPNAKEKIKNDLVRILNERALRRSWDGRLYSIRDGRLVSVQVHSVKRFGLRNRKGEYTVKQLEEMGEDMSEIRELMRTKPLFWDRSDKEMDNTLVRFADYDDPFNFLADRNVSFTQRQEAAQKALDENPVIVNGFSGGVLFFGQDDDSPEAVEYKKVMEEVAPLLDNILNSNNDNNTNERILITFVPTDAYMDTREDSNIMEGANAFGGYFSIMEIGTSTEPVKRIHISSSNYPKLQELVDPNTSEERKQWIRSSLQNYALSILTHEYHHALDASVTSKITEYGDRWSDNHTYHSNNAMTSLLLSSGYLEIDKDGDIVATEKGRGSGIDPYTIHRDANKLMYLFTEEDVEKAFPKLADGTREDMAGYHMARMLQKIYASETVQKLADKHGERAGSYYNTPIETLARLSEDAVFVQILAENDLIDFHPEVEIALFEKIKSDIIASNLKKGIDADEEMFKEVLDYWRYWRRYQKHGGDLDDPSEEIQEYAERLWAFYNAKEEQLSKVSPEVRSVFEGNNHIFWQSVGSDLPFEGNSYPVKNGSRYPDHFTLPEISDISEDFYGWVKGVGSLEEGFKPTKINLPEDLLQTAEEYRKIANGRIIGRRTSDDEIENAVTEPVNVVGEAFSQRRDLTDQGVGAPKPPSAEVIKRRGLLSRLMERVPSKKADVQEFKKNIVITDSTMGGIVGSDVLDEGLDTIASTQKSDAFVEGGKKVQIWGWVAGKISPKWAGDKVYKPDVKGAYFKNENRLGLINPIRKTNEKLSPVEKAQQVDTIVHELGHGYDYGTSVGEGSQPVSASRKIFKELFENNPVFNRLMRKYTPEFFGDRVGLRMINRRREKFKSEVGSIKLSKDRVREVVTERFPKRVETARIRLERRGITDPTDEQIFDEVLEISGLAWEDVSSEITVEYLDNENAFLQAVRISGLEEDRVLQTLSKMSDDEFQELLEDLPYAMQARVTFFRRIATSSKYKNLNSVSESSNFIEGLLRNDEATIDRLILFAFILAGVEEQKNPNAPKKTFNLLELASEFTERDFNQMKYLRDPGELWAFSYAQSMTLEKISQLAGGDEQAKALIKEIILLRTGDESVTEDVKRVLEGVKIANPELYRLADEYVQARSLDESETLIRNLSDVDNVDDAFVIKNALLGVIADDGMSSNPDAVKPKRASVQIDPTKRNEIVSNFQSVMGDRQLSVDEAIKLIPDGKLDVYIDAHENSEDVVDLNGTVISRTEIDEDVYRRIQNQRLAIAAKMKQEKKRRNLDKPSYGSPVLTDAFRGSGSDSTPDFMDMDDFMDISSEELDLMEPDEIRELAEDLEIDPIPKTTPLIKRKIMSTMAERFDEAKRQRAEKRKDEIARAKKFAKLYNKVVEPFVSKAAERFIKSLRAVRGIRADDPIELQEALTQGDEGLDKLVEGLGSFIPFAEALGKSLHTGKIKAKVSGLFNRNRDSKKTWNITSTGKLLRKRSGINLEDVKRIIKNEGAKTVSKKLLENAPDSLKKWLIKGFGATLRDKDLSEEDLDNLSEKFVSVIHEAWADDSQVIPVQLAAAYKAGMSREEIIENVFWMPFIAEGISVDRNESSFTTQRLTKEQKVAVINALLDAVDDDKRIAIVYHGSSEITHGVVAWGIEGRPLDTLETIDRLVAGETYEEIDKSPTVARDFNDSFLTEEISEEVEDFDPSVDVPFEVLSAEELGIAEEEASAPNKYGYDEEDIDKVKALKDKIHHPKNSDLVWDSPITGINKQSLEAIDLLLEAESASVQQVLKDLGIEQITLYRGVAKRYEGGKLVAYPTPSSLEYAPLASFSIEPHTAGTFMMQSGDGVLVEVVVPVDAIVSGFPQGFGSFPEHEFIVDTSKLVKAPTAIREMKELQRKRDLEVQRITSSAFLEGEKDPELPYDDPNYPYIALRLDSSDKEFPAIFESEYVGEVLEEVIGEELDLDLDEATDEEINEAFKDAKEKIEKDIPDIASDLNRPPGRQSENWITVAALRSGTARDRGPAISYLEYDDTDPDDPELATVDSGVGADIPAVDNEITYERSDEDVTVTIAEPIESIADFHKEKKDWSQVTAIAPADRTFVGRAYDSEPELTKEEISGEVTEAWTALADEVEEQWDIITKPESEGGLGITVEFVDEDPYNSFADMRKDFIENKRIKVMKTEATGGHPFFTNEQNDKFRAVHDIFGHLGTGRGFDRHGEEAAYQAHRSMFTTTAEKALATELRGQNTYLLTYGDFGPQKLFILPEHMRKALSAWLEILTKVTKPWSFLISSDKNAMRDSDADNLYDISGSHHVSCGRYIV